MVAITPETLADAAARDPADPRQSYRSLATMGAAGAWLLPRKALESALRYPGANGLLGYFVGLMSQRPRLPDSPGSCNPVFVFTKDAPSGPGLRRSFFLPLQWLPDSPEGESLPLALCELARDVRQACGVDGWGLRLNRHWTGGVNLRRLPVTADSAWAALAAGLLLSADKGRPRGDVALSAAWDANRSRGFLGVEGLEEKARLAAEFNCRVLYVSAADAERAAKCGGLEAKPLPFGEGVPLPKLLQDFLHDMEAAPPADAPLDWRCAYANRFPAALRQEREEYILGRVAAERAAQLRDQAGGGAVGRMAVVMSSPSAAALSLLSMRPNRFALLHTSQHASAAETLRGFLDSHAEPPQGEFHQFGNAEDFGRLAETVRAFLSQGAEEGRKVVDVTGGVKGMTVAAALAARDCGAEIMHVGSSGGGTHRAGEEKIMFVRL